MCGPLASPIELATLATPLQAPLTSFANNDGWCDDASDGPVRARVTMHGSNVTVDADPAWVLVAPPDFAPHLENVVTLYDVVYDRAARLADPSLAVTATSRVSFTRDIYPLLRRVSMLRWVSGVAADKRHAHGENGPNDFIAQVAQLSRNTMDASAMQQRSRIFNALRNPKTGRDGTMPKVPDENNKDVRGPSVTETQYANAVIPGNLRSGFNSAADSGYAVTVSGGYIVQW